LSSFAASASLQLPPSFDAKRGETMMVSSSALARKPAATLERK